jgi:hypothetical protein
MVWFSFLGFIEKLIIKTRPKMVINAEAAGFLKESPYRHTFDS